jgi:hypothetical protein
LEPKVFKLLETSHLNVNDKIVSERLFCYLQAMKPPKPELINQSGRHKANKIVTYSYTFAQISLPFAHIIRALDNKMRKINE